MKKSLFSIFVIIFFISGNENKVLTEADTFEGESEEIEGSKKWIEENKNIFVHKKYWQLQKKYLLVNTYEGEEYLNNKSYIKGLMPCFDTFESFYYRYIKKKPFKKQPLTRLERFAGREAINFFYYSLPENERAEYQEYYPKVKEYKERINKLAERERERERQSITINGDIVKKL